MTPVANRLLLNAALGHVVVAVACVCLLRFHAAPILGVHPALKPLKFAISIALFLGSMAFLVPSLSTGSATQRLLATGLTIAMSSEMLVIALQALRGRRSHFNIDGTADRTIVLVMFAGIAVLIVAMITITWFSCTRPLLRSNREPVPWVYAWAWRAGLALFFFAIVSGFAMGARSRHTIGAADGGPGMPLTNWSSVHGDLRVSHFIALHALQVVPLAGALLARAPIADSVKGITLFAVVGMIGTVAIWAFASALAGRPFTFG